MTRNNYLTFALAGCLLSTGALAEVHHCGTPPPDGGTGHECHPVTQQSIVAGHDGVDTLVGESSGYLEAPLRPIAPGEALELRLELAVDDLTEVAGAAQHAFVELDLDRGDERALLPVRVALQLPSDSGVATLRLDGAKARLLQSAPAPAGAHDLRLHWLQLDSDRGEASLLLDGQVVGTSELRGTPVALRLGDLSLGAGNAARAHLQVRSAELEQLH